MTSSIKEKGKKVFAGSVHVATITGCREMHHKFGPLHSFGITFVADGTHKSLPGHCYFKDVVRDLPTLLSEKGG